MENELYARCLWILYNKNNVVEEWFFVRKQEIETITFLLTMLLEAAQLALWKSCHYFIERIFQDAKSERS